MNCNLIFYMAKKTSLCEKAFISLSSNLKADISNTFFATTPAQLGETIIKAFADSDLVFTIGGVSDYSDTAIEIIMENALADTHPDQSFRINITDSTKEGYLIRKDHQILVILPDDPDAIRQIFSWNLKDFITKYCNN